MKGVPVANQARYAFYIPVLKVMVGRSLPKR
jgi:hypothetical protein